MHASVGLGLDIEVWAAGWAAGWAPQRAAVYQLHRREGSQEGLVGAWISWQRDPPQCWNAQCLPAVLSYSRGTLCRPRPAVSPRYNKLGGDAGVSSCLALQHLWSRAAARGGLIGWLAGCMARSLPWRCTGEAQPQVHRLPGCAAGRQDGWLAPKVRTALSPRCQR